jgi:hypothetical protein
VWVMLPGDCDWRWMEAGNTSVWYPTMRLFRQPRPGDWKAVIAQMVDALTALVQHRDLNTNVLEQTSASNVRLL